MEIIDRETAQYIVDTVKSVCGKDINYIDARGIIIASTDHSRVDSFHEIGYQVVTQGDTKEVSGDESFLGVQKGVNLPVFYHGKVIAAVGISGELEEARKYAALAQKITTILLREREVEARGSQKRSKISYMLRTLLRQDIADYTELKAFFKEKKRSAGYARDRMKLLLISERIDCSPQMMKMLRNDMIHTVKKYLTIDEEQVKIQITQEPAVLHAYIPVLNKKDNRLVSSQLLKRTDKLC